MDVGRYENDDDPHSYTAMLGDIDLVADNPIELLGLAAIHDVLRPSTHEPYWWRIEAEEEELGISDQLLEAAITRALWELRERDPARWQREVASALASVSESCTPAEALGVSEQELPRVLEALKGQPPAVKSHGS